MEYNYNTFQLTILERSNSILPLISKFIKKEQKLFFI